MHFLRKPDWLEKVRKLQQSLVQHMRMEEEQVFPKLKKDLDAAKNAKLTTLVNKAGFMMA